MTSWRRGQLLPGKTNRMKEPPNRLHMEWMAHTYTRVSYSSVPIAFCLLRGWWSEFGPVRQTGSSRLLSSLPHIPTCWILRACAAQWWQSVCDDGKGKKGRCVYWLSGSDLREWIALDSRPEAGSSIRGSWSCIFLFIFLKLSLTACTWTEVQYFAKGHKAHLSPGSLHWGSVLWNKVQKQMAANLQMTPRSQSFNTVHQINNMAQFFQSVLSAQSEKCLEILKYNILPSATSPQKELSVLLASFTPLSVFISWLFPMAT